MYYLSAMVMKWCVFSGARNKGIRPGVLGSYQMGPTKNQKTNSGRKAGKLIGTHSGQPIRVTCR